MELSNTLKQLVDNILAAQRQEFQHCNTDNYGASIDALSVIQKLMAHKRYASNKKALAFLIEIEAFEVEHDALKYAKPLTKYVQNGAYHSVRKALA